MDSYAVAHKFSLNDGKIAMETALVEKKEDVHNQHTNSYHDHIRIRANGDVALVSLPLFGYFDKGFCHALGAKFISAFLMDSNILLF